MFNENNELIVCFLYTRKTISPDTLFFLCMRKSILYLNNLTTEYVLKIQNHCLETVKFDLLALKPKRRLKTTNNYVYLKYSVYDLTQKKLRSSMRVEPERELLEPNLV